VTREYRCGYIAHHRLSQSNSVHRALRLRGLAKPYQRMAAVV